MKKVSNRCFICDYEQNHKMNQLKRNVFFLDYGWIVVGLSVGFLNGLNTLVGLKPRKWLRIA